MKTIVQTGTDVRFAHPLTRAFQFAVSLGFLISCLIEVVLQKCGLLAVLIKGKDHTCDQNKNDYSEYNLHKCNLWGIDGFSMEGNHALL